MITLVRNYGLLLIMTVFISVSTQANELDLSAYKGKVIYIDFWASWCSPCRQSFPWMNSLQVKNAKDGLVILAINVDQERKLADKFINELKPNFTILFDKDGKFASDFKVAGMPSAFIIGRDGTPRFKHIGFHQDKTDQYEQEIQLLLNEKY